MFTKTSIALAIIVAISSGAVAAPKHQNGAGAYGASPVPAPVLRCVHGTWDPNGVRCDGLDD
jgi:hypothetical protein